MLEMIQGTVDKTKTKSIHKTATRQKLNYIETITIFIPKTKIELFSPTVFG